MRFVQLEPDVEAGRGISISIRQTCVGAVRVSFQQVAELLNRLLHHVAVNLAERIRCRLRVCRVRMAHHLKARRNAPPPKSGGDSETML